MARKITRCAICDVKASDTRPSTADTASAPVPVCEPCGHLIDAKRAVDQGALDQAATSAKLALATAWTGRQTNMAFSMQSRIAFAR